MSQSNGGGLIFCSLIVLTVLSYCTRPDVGTIDFTAPQGSNQVSATVSASTTPPSSLLSELSSTRYVRSPELNIRTRPKGPIIGTLKRAAPVQVYETKGKWARISVAGQPEQWVSEPNLCGVAGCADLVNLADSAKLTSSLQDTRQTIEPIRYRSDASECPCSGGTNCIGPRGGRYCITSGGNKRYR
ncbi:MAG: SH3 domain-containing protein [Alphaproteobacteria bacterium]|nr:MAG: SH3 domain-containing protein [Alphaproteobacteria bacterium]